MAVEVEREGHEALEQLAAHPGDDPLAHGAQDVGLDEAAQRLGEEQDEQGGDQPVEPRAVAAGHDLGHQARDDQRHQQAQPGPEDKSGDRDPERPVVGPEVAEQAPPRDAGEAADAAGDLDRG